MNSLVQLLHDRPGWHGEDDALRTLIGKPYDYTEVEAADTVTRAHALGWIVFGPRDQTGAFRLRLSGAGRLMLETSDER